MIELCAVLAVLLLAHDAFSKRKARKIKEAKEKRTSWEKEAPATPVVPDIFDLEYKVGNINLCLNEDKGGFNLFVQVGNFKPRFEEVIEGKSLAEALAYSLKENGLKI